MHEYAIGRNLVRAILSELDKLGPPAPKILKARVVVGKLRQVVPEILTSAYESLSRGTRLEGSKIEIIPAPIKVKCQECGWTGEIEDFRFQCRMCSSGDLQLLGGKELYLENLTVEKDEESGG